MPSTSFIEVDGVRLEVSDIPGGPGVIVLLHEGLGSVSLWRNFPALVARRTGCRVVTYSRSGHGRSDPAARPRTPAWMHVEAEVLGRLLEVMHLEQAVLVGHSDGASIALIHAAGGRCRASGLVLIAPHVFVEEETIQSIERSREAFATTDLSSRLARHHDDPEHTFRLWNDIWLDPAFADWNIESCADGLILPTLVIQGRLDEYGTAAQYTSILERAASADVLVLSRSGHSPHRDRPAAVLDAIASFVRGTSTTMDITVSGG